MLEIFHKGGLIMWPLLLASVVSLGVAVERLIFIMRERSSRDADLVQKILVLTKNGDVEAAIEAGRGSRDFVARTLVQGLMHRGEPLSNALIAGAKEELKRFGLGLPVLDTIITLAPLLGLLGTVTGMIGAFGLLGGKELDAPSAITGGIAEALIATAFGLSIAIVSLIPFNYLNTRLEEARHEIEDACNKLELFLLMNNSKKGGRADIASVR
jgi:biopolymer transport protein ExbB